MNLGGGGSGEEQDRQANQSDTLGGDGDCHHPDEGSESFLRLNVNSVN